MRRAALAVLGAGALLLVGCENDEETDGSGSGEGGGQSELVVLAASSLTDAFGRLEHTYEADHPDVEVQLSFDASSTLAEQVVSGAPGDVLATADERTMQTVVDEGLAGVPLAFAQNSLIQVTPPDNPAGVQELADLDSGEVEFAVCVPDAPCGAATERLFELVDVSADPVTEEANVRDVLTRVTEGEVDAGLVYVSDAQAASEDVHAIEIPQADQALNSDVIAPLSEASDPGAAQAWVDLVTSDKGQQVLTDLGFLPPP